MARRRHTTISVDVEVDVFDVLAAVNTVDLINELNVRGTERSGENAGWQRLADLIAEGSTHDALSLLHDLCPATTHTAAATMRFVEARRQH